MTAQTATQQPSRRQMKGSKGDHDDSLKLTRKHPEHMESLTKGIAIQDRIEDHARQAWALSEFLLAYYNDSADGRSTMSEEVMSGLMENMAEHLRALRELNHRLEVSQ